MGTPIQAFDSKGNVVWDCVLDIYGDVLELRGNRCFIPFRYQGQYEDQETGLYYNRFRYYSPNIGNYISQDPIGLLGNNPTLYAYTFDSNSEVDIWGLIIVYRNLNPNDNIFNGLSAKNPGRGMSPSGHIMNGSKPTFKGSQYISTTTDIEIAQKWKKQGLDIVTFDTDDVIPDNRGNLSIIDVSTPEKARNAGLKGRAYANAVSSKEVLVEGYIPSDKIKIVCN